MYKATVALNKSKNVLRGYKIHFFLYVVFIYICLSISNIKSNKSFHLSLAFIPDSSSHSPIKLSNNYSNKVDKNATTPYLLKKKKMTR